jgi:prefoldin subunit 5
VLYQHVHVDRKSRAREVILKEMQLSNQLNDIHFEGYDRLLSKMRDNLAQKDKQMGELSQECAKVKKDLLESTVQYNEAISRLKEQLARLKVESSALARGSRSLQRPREESETMVTDEKITGLQR